MIILVKDTDFVYRLECNKFTSIYRIKNDLVTLIKRRGRAGDIKADDLVLSKNGRVLENNEPLYFYNIGEDSLLNVGYRMRGGSTVLGTESSNFSTPIYLVCVFFFFMLPLFISGLLPIFGHIYGASVAGIIREVGRKIIVAWNKASRELKKEEASELESYGIEMSSLKDKGGQQGGVVQSGGDGGKSENSGNSGNSGNRGNSGNSGNSGNGVKQTLDTGSTQVYINPATVSVESLTAGLGESATQFINDMSDMTPDYMADPELVCTLAAFKTDFETADVLRNPVLSRYYNKTYISAKNDDAPPMTASENAVAYLKYLQKHILSSGASLDDCVVGHPVFKKVIKLGAWIFKVFGMVLFVWIITYVVISPLVFAYTSKKSAGLPTVACTAVTLTKHITLTLVLVFIGVYIATGIPTLAESTFESAVYSLPTVPSRLLGAVVIPVTSAMSRFATQIEQGFFVLVTGGWLSTFQNGIHTGLQMLYMGLAEANVLSCSNPTALTQLGNRLAKLISEPHEQMEAENYRLVGLANVVIDSLSEEKMKQAKEQGNYLNYFMAQGVRKLFCWGLTFSAWLFRMFKGIGSEMIIENLVVNGAISGVAYFIAFLVIFILIFLKIDMFGISYG